MCYSKKLSLSSFIFGIFSSLMLIQFGNKESYKTNVAIGLFFIFLSIMQLIEYFIWNDIECKNGLNKLGSYLGPLFNHLQPVVLLIIASIYLKSFNIISINIIIFLNILYITYVLYQYYVYICDVKNICIGVNNKNHLDWKWKYNFKYLFYFAISLINIINFYKNNNLIITILVSYLLLFISYFKFHTNIGELWCLMISGVPLVNLFIQKVFHINN